MTADFELGGRDLEHHDPTLRFLIIDDSITMRRIIANILGRLGYPEVVHAGNGREALDRLASERIDVVITDWYMPEMNGLDFVKSLRSTPGTMHIPIVIVTANAASDDIQHALELGVSSYILKPFTAETMRDKINAVCAQAAATRRPAPSEPSTSCQPDAPGISAEAAAPTNGDAPMASSEAAAHPEAIAAAEPIAPLEPGAPLEPTESIALVPEPTAVG